MPSDTELNLVIDVGLIFSSTLSTFGSGFIIITFFLVRDWTFPNNLIFWLSVCDFCYAICYFYLYPPDNWFCYSQAIWANFFGLAAQFWTLIIAIIYWSQLYTFGRRLFRFQKLYHIIVWGLSTFLSFLPLAFNDYGVDVERNIPKCWLKNTGDLARFWATYFETMLIMIIITVLYFHLIYNLRVRKGVQHKWRTRFSLYPLVFWIIWIGPCILRILEFFKPDQDYRLWIAIQAITMPLQGFLNSLVYGFRSDLVTIIKIRMQNKGELTTVKINSTSTETDPLL